jgi:AraC-like DNA-binding protein
VYRSGAQEQSPASVKIANAFRELLFAHARTMHLATGYAAMLNISPNHLNKAVKAATSKPVSRWIDEAIILEAKVLLGQSDVPVHEVAATVGLDDPSYFTRLFKKYEGVTPTAFRKMIEKS